MPTPPITQTGQPPGCADRCGSSGLHLSGTVDDVCGYASLCESAVVCAVGVVEAQVGIELAFEPCVAGVEVARERGSPALVEDRLVQRLDVPVGLRPAGVDAGVAHLQRLECRGEVALELVAVVAEHPLQLPAGGLQLPCDTSGEDAGLSGGWVALLADHKLGPGVGGGNVDRGELPDRALGASESADVEAVDPHQLAGPLNVDVALWLWGSGWLIGRCVARDQPEALRAGVQPVAAEHLPHSVRRDDDPAPLLPGELRGDASGTEAGVSDREGHDPLLDHLRQRVGHLRPTTLPWPEHLEPVPVDLALPGVVGGAMHPERPARRRDVRPRCLREKLLAVAEQHVILGHQAQPLSSLGGEGGSLSRGTDGFPGRGTRPNLKDLSNPQLSGAPRDSPSSVSYTH